MTTWARVGGAELAYDVAGGGEGLLLVHGAMGDRRMWDDQFGRFAERFRTVRLDLRGVSESSAADEEFAFHDDFAAVLDAAGLERAHVAGVSFGGALVVDFALAYPERVLSLVLIASGVIGRPFSEETMARINEADALVESGDIAAGVETELRLWIDGPRRTPEEVDAGTRERMREMQMRVYGAGIPQWRPRFVAPPAVGRLGEISAPVLIIEGAEDVADMHENALLLEREIPQARRVVIDGAGHHPHMEKPEEVNRVILDFLERQGQGVSS